MLQDADEVSEHAALSSKLWYYETVYTDVIPYNVTVMRNNLPKSGISFRV